MTAPFNHLTLLIDSNHLKQGVKAIAQQIRADLADQPEEAEPVMVVVLKGGALFGVDLLRALRRPMPVVFVPRSGAYESQVPGSDQALLRGRHLIVVDTLMDSGNTLRILYRWLETLEPASIRLAVLLHKTVDSANPLIVNYLGYEVPDVRLVGYGLDEEECFRGLPAVYTWWQAPSGNPFSPETVAACSDAPKKKKSRRRDEQSC
ncbi:MAG: hypothetical protein HQL90_07270 [Magnetococcales bacterium]|nr:hypothetical protein [Magnetococcales bacterium]